MDSGILDEVQALVCDALQVVSYKWLSRKFSVSSNAAKRVLQEFADQNDGDQVEVVYVVSGWTKSDPRTYSVQLVPKAKLQEAKQELGGSPSQHVYSVQPCLPKDPAQLFSAELVQAQELFMQPPDVDNCLRDNRFSSVSCSLVTRSVGGSKSVIYQQKAAIPSSASVPAWVTPAPAKSLSDSKAPKIEAPLPPQPVPPVVAVKKEEVPKSFVRGAAIKEEGSGKSSTTIAGPAKGAAENVATAKKKVGASGGGSSLANLWGKAPAKTKASSPSEIPVAAKTVPIAGDAEAGIRAMEGNGSESSSDDDTADFAHIRRSQVKKGKGRNRRTVFEDEDMSENEEEIDPEAVVNLASPEPSKPKTHAKREDTKLKTNDFLGATDMEVDEERAISGEEVQANHSRSQPDVITSTPEHSGQPVEHLGGVKREGEVGPTAGISENVPSRPKRQKVLKTRIDDRGREVTEVVWEVDGVEETPEAKPASAPAPAPNKATTAAGEPKPPAERPAAAAAPVKLPSGPQKTATKASGKAGAKPAPKGQGNIMSFFKKKT